MELVIKLFDVLFPVFLIIGIGYWYGKKDPKFDTKFITTFAGNFGLPAIIFYSLTSTNISIELFLRFSFYITLYVLIFAIIGIIILKILKKDIYRLLPPLILPNTGNMGMPLCLFAYGNMGLAIATAATSMILVFHFSLNILLASKKLSIKPLLNCIPVYALLISLFFVYFEIPSPKFLENATFLIGYSTIFLVLMSLGIALSKLKVFSFKETLIYSSVRVIIGPIVGFGFVKFFNLSGVEAGVMFIQASMPSAILTYLVSKIYSPKKISDSIASTVALSTFLSFFTLIIVVFIALKYFN
jgi:malate permease and related proteins|tara:strand:+ start:359 stop:1258 length:900 start_codon:yes stop_codon:yes gene_type:complete